MGKVSHDSEILAEGQQVISATGFIHHKFNGIEKVFLPKRAATKKFLPGIYEMPGGHIDYGEDIVEGLKREIKEELSMGLSVGDCFWCFTYQNLVKKSHSIEVVYFAVFTDPLEQITIQLEDHSEFGWFSKEEVKSGVIKNRQSLKPKDFVQHNLNYDPEYQAILKGFELLKGDNLNFG